MATAYVLQINESVMCAFCLNEATLFIVKTPSTGELLAVCPRHINK